MELYHDVIQLWWYNSILIITDCWLSVVPWNLVTVEVMVVLLWDGKLDWPKESNEDNEHHTAPQNYRRGQTERVCLFSILVIFHF